MMRPIEILIGGLLITSGYAIPTTGPAALPGISDEVGISAWSYDFDYSGNANVSASDAILRTQGSFEAEVEGTLSLEIWECYSGGWDVDISPVTWDHRSGNCSATDPKGITNASMKVEGTGDSVLYAWTPPSAPTLGNMTLEVDEVPLANVQPSAYADSIGFSHGYHGRHVEAPVFSLGHGTSSKGSYELTILPFDRFHSTGKLRMVAHTGTTVTIDNAGGTETYETTTEEWQRIGVEPAQIVVGEKQRYLVVTLTHANATIELAEANSIFIAKEAIWDIDGTVAVNVEHGNVSSDSNNRELEDALVETQGNITLKTRTEGMGTASKNIITGVTTPSVISLSDPEVQLEMDSDPEATTIDGAPMRPSPQYVQTRPLMTEDATLVAKLIGFLLVAWGAARGLLLFAPGMVADDPLKNPRRREIHTFLLKSGLSHLSEIKRATGIPLGSLVYHLTILQRGNIITKLRRSSYTVYFPQIPGLCRADMHRLSLLAHPTRRAICRSLAESPDQSQAKLAQCVGVSQPTISRQLTLLRSADLVERSAAREGTYRISDLVRRWYDRPVAGLPCKDEAKSTKGASPQ